VVDLGQLLASFFKEQNGTYVSLERSKNAYMVQTLTSALLCQLSHPKEMKLTDVFDQAVLWELIGAFRAYIPAIGLSCEADTEPRKIEAQVATAIDLITGCADRSEDDVLRSGMSEEVSSKGKSGMIPGCRERVSSAYDISIAIR